MSFRTTVPEDIYKFEWPSNPTISPDGKQVVYERTVTCVKENIYETHLYLSDVHGKSRKILTSSGTSNTNPVWSPDGKTIAFISNRAYGRQVWLLSLDGGEARCLTRFLRGISSIVWSPDGSTIYGLVPVAGNSKLETFHDQKTMSEAESDIEKGNMSWGNGPKHYTNLYYKSDGIGFHKPQKRQLVAINIETCSFTQLTRGTTDVHEPVVSPDCKYIAFSTSSEDENFLFGGQIYRVPASGGEVELLYSNKKASLPSYSPDGKWIAFFGIHADQKQLFVMPAAGGKPRCLSKQYPDTLADMTFTDMRYLRYSLRPQWSNNSSYVYGLGTREGRNEIVRFSIDENDDRAEIIIGGDRTIFHYSYDGVETITIAYSTVNHPGKAAVIRIDEASTVDCKYRQPKEAFSQIRMPLFPETEIRLDDCNDELLSELKVVEPEVFTYRSEDNWHIQGFLLRPANFDPKKKYPVILDIHGGPHSAYGFSYFHQLQLFAAQGYAVIYTNPRGSSGFSEEFTNAVHGDYGGKDMKDILNGLDYALQNYHFFDENRVAVNGISYGGFMVNWLITRTDRFFAAISEGCISNWISMYGTSDIAPYFIEQEFLGKTDLETLWRFSPLAYADHVQTPLLLLHNESDLRCPIEQAEQFYSHIKRYGGEVEFVRIPHSSHGLLQYGKPELRIARLNAMLDFVNAHLPIKNLQTSTQ
ncbi:S9 family peptidase [Cytobacillus sp. SAFR-174]|uniref:S9 family peptidase n=1 Tax=Cytobacillus sp. SAFR-174 TaxID=3436868 RepID=UPI003F81C062